MNNQIIVPVDGSANALRALDVAVDLARQRRLGILLVHIVPPGGVPEGLREWASAEHVHEMPQWLYTEGLAKGLLDSAQNHIAAHADIEIDRGVECGGVAKSIIDMSMRSNVEMVVMGSRGLSDFAGIVLGSVAHRVAHGAHCPVVTVT